MTTVSGTDPGQVLQRSQLGWCLGILSTGKKTEIKLRPRAIANMHLDTVLAANKSLVELVFKFF